MASAWGIRELRVNDLPLLVVAVMDNLNWREPRFTEDDILSRAEFRHYSEVRFDRGDFGTVADDERGVVGIGWAQFLPPDDRGYGFIDGDTPEVSLWVRADRRSEGIGRALLRELQSSANGRGIDQLSLSVEPDNHASDLYRTEGFLPVPGRETDGVMVWTA